MIRDLDSGDFDRRQAAADALLKMGPTVEAALENALAARPTLEASRRLEQILHRLAEKPPSIGTIRMIRAIEVLEYLRTDAARAALQEVAAGPRGDRVVEEARAALRRIQSQPAR